MIPREMFHSYDKTLAFMKQQMGDYYPEFELETKAQLVVEIEALKKKKNAIVLGHNYMEPAIYHTVADFTGDSLELCRKAAETTADTIVFCGVEFMAETAKIINPERQVLIPSQRAGCSLAQSITAEDVRHLRKLYPGVPVVTYINTYADVKAETDICCTSGNAAKVVASLNSDTVIFIPDEYLAKNVALETGKKIIFPITDVKRGLSEGSNIIPSTNRDQGNLEKVFIGWHGKCEVHEKFTVEDIKRVRSQFPDVVILSHPECSPEVVMASDFSGSTSAMIKFVENKKAARYLLLTECSMGDNIMAANKDKEILRLCSIRCPHMGQITLEQTRDALLYSRYAVEVPENIRIKARASIDRMLRIY
jgi:quinolinate synthase